MHPYWAKFERFNEPTFLNVGVGVTARSEDDARRLVEAAFPEARIASLALVDDVSALDQGRVVSNMGNILARGIWFPGGYEQIAGDVR
jgi:hypothetical protein